MFKNIDNVRKVEF